MADIIKKQKQSLVQSIKDAEKSEINRMKRLALVTTSGEKSVLLRRYEKERQNDQERIENLSKDFFTLQQKLVSGDLGQLQEQRSSVTQHTTTTHRTDGSNKNRFVGLESHNDIIFHTAVCDKFDKFDGKFQERRNRPVFDKNAEVRKLKLLNDKRTLLKQLVSMHVAEHGGGQQQKTGRSETSSGYARSESNFSRGSEASYATFGSCSRGVPYRPRPNVPTLGIPVPEY